MEVRIGEILVSRGAMSSDEVEQVLRRQRDSGEPFGVICERMLGLGSSVIEDAWSEQYATMTQYIDLVDSMFDPSVAEIVTRRQAWQFRVVPIRYERQELMLATAQDHLARALRFATMVIGIPVYLVVTEPRRLGEWLCEYYPIPGMTPESVQRDSFDALLARCRMGEGARDDEARRRSLAAS